MMGAMNSTIILDALLLFVIFGISFWLVKDVPEEGSSSKLNYLEGIRGTAAFLVVIFHFFRFFFPAMVVADPAVSHIGWEGVWAKSPLYALYSGTLCVSIFFVLSGFVLSYGFFRKNQKRILVSSACRRYFRLAWPVLMTCTVYLLLMETHVLDPVFFKMMYSQTLADNFQNRYAFEPGLLDMLKSVLWNTFFELYHGKYNNVLWTMSVEFIGSMIVFGCLLLTGLTVWRYWVYGLLTAWIILVLRVPDLVGFVSGMVLCDLWVSGRLNRLNHPVVKRLALLVGLYFVGFNDYLPIRFLDETPYAWMQLALNWSSGLFLPGHLLIGLGATLLLFVVLTSHSVQTFFSQRFFIFLGKISFALYLSHYMILLTMTCYGFLWLKEFVPYSVAATLSFIISIPIMFGVSYVFYWFGDRGSIQIGRKFYNSFMEPILMRSSSFIKQPRGLFQSFVSYTKVSEQQ